jgi:hypothetical protein
MHALGHSGALARWCEADDIQRPIRNNLIDECDCVFGMTHSQVFVYFLRARIFTMILKGSGPGRVQDDTPLANRKWL